MYKLGIVVFGAVASNGFNNNPRNPSSLMEKNSAVTKSWIEMCGKCLLIAQKTVSLYTSIYILKQCLLLSLTVLNESLNRLPERPLKFKARIKVCWLFSPLPVNNHQQPTSPASGLHYNTAMNSQSPQKSPGLCLEAKLFNK